MMGFGGTLEVVDSLESLRPGWSDLAARTGNVFATPEWLETWWRHFGEGRRLLAGRVLDEGGETAGLLPLYLQRRYGLTMVRFLGHSAGDRLGPIYLAEHRRAVADGLRRLLAGERWQVFVGDLLPAEEEWDRVVGARVVETVGSPVLGLEGLTWDDYLASRSRHLRSRVGNYERRVGREHQATYRLADDPERLQEDLDVLFWLHNARWKGRRSSFGGSTEAFHREFAELAFHAGWLRLWFLELDGRVAAAWYGLRYAGTDSYYQAGRDPAFDRLSVGFVLLMHTLREAISDGMREYRFLRGSEDYKYRFADQDPQLATMVRARGLAGQGALALGRRLRRRARFLGGL
jgi:CelD/BcsL family acetyltransferase involved in cellulose biosynthesis